MVVLRDNLTDAVPLWPGPRTVTVARNESGFGFTLRHFIVYPPESAFQSDGQDSGDPDDGTVDFNEDVTSSSSSSMSHRHGQQRRRKSKLAALEPMDTMFVKQVKEGGAAQKGGLQRGDRIVAVNGEPVTGKTYAHVISLIQRSGSLLNLLVVPKDEDILQVAYQSVYKPAGLQPSPHDLPSPPPLHYLGEEGADTLPPPPPSSSHVPPATTHYKTELQMPSCSQTERPTDNRRRALLNERSSSLGRVDRPPTMGPFAVSYSRSQTTSALFTTSTTTATSTSTTSTFSSSMRIDPALHQRTHPPSGVDSIATRSLCDLPKSQSVDFENGRVPTPNAQHLTSSRQTVSERLRKFESMDSVNSSSSTGSELEVGKMLQRFGCSSVASRAARYEMSADDTSAKSRIHYQTEPPVHVTRAPATINIYFRSESPQPASLRLELSPERRLAPGHLSGTRPASAPGGPMVHIHIGKKDAGAAVGRGNGDYHKPALRQPSYLCAIHSPKRPRPHTFCNNRDVTMTAGGVTAGNSTVTLRQRTPEDERDCKIHRRTSYMMATKPPALNVPKERSSLGAIPGSPQPPRYVASRAKLDLPLDDSVADSNESCDLSMEARLEQDSQENSTTTPTKPSNIRKLKAFFGEKTPRIELATIDNKYLFDMPVCSSDVSIEGMLGCKVAVTDGKRASDRSWKPVWALLRDHQLYLFKDRGSTGSLSSDDPPVSTRSSLIDIAHDYTKRKHVFRLMTSSGCEYLLQADDHGTMMHWIRAMQGNSSPEATTAPPLSPTIQKVSTSSLQHAPLLVPTMPIPVPVALPQVPPSQQQPPPVSDATAKSNKKLLTRSLKSKSVGASPAFRPKKYIPPDKEDYMKSKDSRTWKGRVVRKFKRYGSSSTASSMDTSSTEVTGTFGVPLHQCPPSNFFEFVPLVVELCTEIVEARGLDMQGIYRVPGNTGAVNMLIELFNNSDGTDELDLENGKWADVNVVSSLLKAFFRKLPDPLISEENYESVIAANRTEKPERRMLKLKKVLHELPDHNFETFRFLAQHLNRVASRDDVNKMDARNLAIVFGPTLVRTKDDSMTTMVRDMADQCRIIETVILHHDWFFSSWDEDVYVPIDEESENSVPLSGMNEELLSKAENLDLGGRDLSAKDLVSSIVKAANRRIRRKEKSKSSDSIELDADSESSYSERNIDRELELRRHTKLESSSSSHSVASSVNVTAVTADADSLQTGGETASRKSSDASSVLSSPLGTAPPSPAPVVTPQSPVPPTPPVFSPAVVQATPPSSPSSAKNLPLVPPETDVRTPILGRGWRCRKNLEDVEEGVDGGGMVNPAFDSTSTAASEGTSQQMLDAATVSSDGDSAHSCIENTQAQDKDSCLEEPRRESLKPQDNSAVNHEKCNDHTMTTTTKDDSVTQEKTHHVDDWLPSVVTSDDLVTSLTATLDCKMRALAASRYSSGQCCSVDDTMLNERSQYATAIRRSARALYNMNARRRRHTLAGIEDLQLLTTVPEGEATAPGGSSPSLCEKDSRRKNAFAKSLDSPQTRKALAFKSPV